MGARVLLCGFYAGLVWVHTGALRRVPDPDVGPQTLPARSAEHATAQVDRFRRVLMAWTPQAGSAYALEMWSLYLGYYEEALNFGNRDGATPNATLPSIERFQKEMVSTRPAGGDAETRELVAQDLFKFKVTMNPFHRAVSMYTHAMQKNWSLMHRPGLWDNDPESVDTGAPAKNFVEKLRFFVQSQFGPATDPNNLTFLQFLRSLQALELEHAGLYPSKVHITYAPQSTQEEAAWDVICQVERADACVRELNAKSAWSFAVPPAEAAFVERQGPQRVTFGHEVATTPFKTLEGMKSGSLPMVEDFYAGDAGKRAAHWVRVGYAEDFRKYGYPSEEVPTSDDLAGKLFLLS